MKKLILLFSVIALTFSSCSSDDDSSVGVDPFIGTWKFHKSFEDGVEDVFYFECMLLDKMYINSNGTIKIEEYDLNTSEDCVVDYTEEGTWVNLGEGMYKTTYEEDEYAFKVVFEGDTMYTEDEEDGSIFRTVYIRQ